jgi:hypothetical protein
MKLFNFFKKKDCLDDCGLFDMKYSRINPKYINDIVKLLNDVSDLKHEIRNNLYLTLSKSSIRHRELEMRNMLENKLPDLIKEFGRAHDIKMYSVHIELDRKKLQALIDDYYSES